MIALNVAYILNIWSLKVASSILCSLTKYRKYRLYSHGFSKLALHIHTFL